MTVRQIGEMDYAEFVLWGRYLARKAQAQELEAKKAK